MSGLFAYETAFSRNLGWVTQAEQMALRGKRIAIAGMGGVGGGHLLALARPVAAHQRQRTGQARSGGQKADRIGKPAREQQHRGGAQRKTGDAAGGRGEPLHAV